MLTLNGLNTGAHGLEQGDSQTQSRLASKLKWQLALEKAYLDNESEHVSSGGRSSLPKVEAKASSDDKTDIMQESRLPIPQDKLTPESIPSSCEVRNTTDLAPQASTKGTAWRPENVGRQLGAATVDIPQTVQGSAREHTSRITIPAQSSTAFAHSAERESVRLVKVGDGMQLIIRSGELDGEAALRLSKEVQRVLAEKGQPLVRVFLNGQSLWDAGDTPHGVHSDSEFAEYRINKTY